MTAAQAHINDALTRAQLCWDQMVGSTGQEPDSERRLVANVFMFHVATSVLLEHLRRINPGLANQLTEWLLAEDSIFADGYAGELLHQWRQQLAAGQQMHPLLPLTEDDR